MEMKYKRIPWYWKLSPFAYGAYAAASDPYILLSKKLYEEVLSGTPSLDTLGIIEHEKAHLLHQKMMGKWKLIFKYWFSPRFRLQEELYAERARFAFLKSRGGTVDLDHRARRMSGILYGWMVSYNRARILLIRIWDES